MPLSTVTMIAPLCLGLLEPPLVSRSAPSAGCGGGDDGGFDPGGRGRRQRWPASHSPNRRHHLVEGGETVGLTRRAEAATAVAVGRARLVAARARGTRQKRPRRKGMLHTAPTHRLAVTRASRP